MELSHKQLAHTSYKEPKKIKNKDYNLNNIISGHNYI
jgi:hypothetical protein